MQLSDGTDRCLPEGLGDDLMRIVRLVAHIKQHAPSPHPAVDPMSLPLLFTLCQEPSRVSELAAKLHAEISTVSRQVTHLAALGLVTREADPSDARARQLTLTDDGQELLRQLRTRRDAWLAELTADWPNSEIQTLARLLNRFANNLTTHSEAHLATLKDHP